MRKLDLNWIDYLYILVVWVCSYPRSLILNIYQGIFRLLNLYRGFEIDDEGMLIKYTGKGGDVKIPNSVKSIGGKAFWGCRSLVSIVIPDSVTTIGDRVFGRCSSLTSIEIPGSVTSSGRNVFSGCSSIASVVVPGSVTTIGDFAFYGGTSL